MPINMNDIDNLIASLISKNPGGGREKCAVAYLEALGKSHYAEHVQFIAMTVFRLRYRKAEQMVLSYSDAEEAARKEALRARKKAIEEAVEAAKARRDKSYVERWTNLMDQEVQPYGKPFRLCTVAELRKVSGWLESACKGYDDDEVAGDIFTSAYLKEFWDNYKPIGGSTGTSKFPI